jgi:hypothetical protein
MIILTVFLGLFVLCSSEPLVGGWNEQNGASESDFELAKWATNQLARLAQLRIEFCPLACFLTTCQHETSCKIDSIFYTFFTV